MGGQYIENGQKPNWKHHLLVFNGENKAKDLMLIWDHLQVSPLRERLLIIEEFHNILKQDKELMLNVIREIRKYFVSPTLITQNVREFLRSDEGKMIIDNCSMKFLMHQGENDMADMEDLFGLSKQEKLYLKTCRVGHGYLYTDLFKTKFRVDYSTKEHAIITTNPKEKVGNRYE